MDDGGADIQDGDGDGNNVGQSGLPPRHALALRHALERAVRERRSDNDSLSQPFFHFLAELLASYSQFVVLNIDSGNNAKDGAQIRKVRF